MTGSTTTRGGDERSRTIERGSADWPTFAPDWAQRATIEPHDGSHLAGVVTFERAWTIPSQFRDTDPLAVVRVGQEWTAGEQGGYVPGTPRVAAAPGDLWADWRADEVAAALREIAGALGPEPCARGLVIGAGERTV